MAPFLQWLTRQKPLLVMLGWQGALQSPVLVFVWRSPSQRATLLMAWGLFLFWVLGFGTLSFWVRDRVRMFVLDRRWLPLVVFVAGCTLLACVEEAITVLMTNCGPLFGVPLGAAFITASSNYFDTIFFHSVIVFVPMFLAWGVLLSRFAFSPRAVFWTFGITGWLAETITFGPHNVLMFGQWIPVYGLMAYLPAYAFSARAHPRPRPSLLLRLGAVFLPFAFEVVLLPYFLLRAHFFRIILKTIFCPPRERQSRR